jgi:hypothetical protein
MTHTALPSATADKTLYRCGTLTYTKAGLFFLFAWLLWGDFCLHLVGAAMPSVLRKRSTEPLYPASLVSM